MDHQNITLSLPKELLRRVKHLAVERDTSVSALLIEALEEAVLAGDEYDVVMNGSFVVRDSVVAAIRALRAAGYTTALLTNSFKEFRPVLEAAVDFSIFDDVIDSSEVGHRKPEPAIYELTRSRLGVRADEVVYLDDFLANVEGARAAGWTAVHVTGEAEVLAAIVEATGVELG